MNNKFDELTRNLAQSVTRRAALKRLGVGLAGMALAFFGLAANAGPGGNDNCANCMKGCKLTGGSSQECKSYCKGIGSC